MTDYRCNICKNVLDSWEFDAHIIDEHPEELGQKLYSEAISLLFDWFADEVDKNE